MCVYVCVCVLICCAFLSHILIIPFVILMQCSKGNDSRKSVKQLVRYVYVHIRLHVVDRLVGCVNELQCRRNAL